MDKEMKRKAILNDALLPLLIKTSIPTIIGMLVMVIYNLTDTFFVGILNNKSMTAAIGIVFSFMSFIQALGFWFGYGSGNRKKYHVAGGNIGVGRMLALNIACFDRITCRIVCKRRGIPCRKREVYYEMLLNS